MRPVKTAAAEWAADSVSGPLHLTKVIASRALKPAAI